MTDKESFFFLSLLVHRFIGKRQSKWRNPLERHDVFLAGPAGEGRGRGGGGNNPFGHSVFLEGHQQEGMTKENSEIFLQELDFRPCTGKKHQSKGLTMCRINTLAAATAACANHS